MFSLYSSIYSRTHINLASQEGRQIWSAPRELFPFLRPQSEEGYPQVVIEMWAQGQAVEKAMLGDDHRVQFEVYF